MSFTLPSLLIQPLVENAIVHGIQPCRGNGVVVIAIKPEGERIRISVTDTGSGISESVIEQVRRNEQPSQRIGLLNVHQRVALLYGEGLHIRRREPGTEIWFYLTAGRRKQAA